MNSKFKIYLYFITNLILAFALITDKIHAIDSKLQFIDVPLSEVLTELSIHYSINFIYSDALVEHNKVSYNLTDLNADLAIQNLLIPLNISFKLINKNTYVLYNISRPVMKQNRNNETRITATRTPSFTPPKVISNVQISYPDIAKEKSFEGVVDMQIYINENGSVETVKIQKSSNFDILDHAAIAYAQNIKFRPAKIDSQSVAVWSKWKFVFELVPFDTTYSEVTFEEFVR